MSSYVANSFYKQSPPVPAYAMQSYGNYGSVPEVQPPRYRYGGLDLSITPPSSGAASLAMSATTRANPERSKSSGEIKAEPVQTAQQGGPQLQQQQPPQIYPWMTKLHMSH
ncbi:PREDICTED: homeobox protein Hox-C5-like, partial [Phaethon lepturus]|uniref:homeobox protein Hox-C5-like n=1 Tax=Phaethon lepturus TaxID=97097 RepID=UPI000530AB5B